MIYDLWKNILRYLGMKSNGRLTHKEIQAGGNVPPPPSEDYLKALDMFDNVLRECMFVSRDYGGLPAETGKHFYASVLFTSLISRSVSLAMLAPHTPWATKMIEHWDYASAAIILRTMLELRAAFHYLCVEACSDDEWQCRWNLLNLHDCISRKRLFEARAETTSQAVKFDAEAENLRERLKSNAHFLTVANQKKLLNGQTPYLYPIELMLEKAGLEKETYRFFHVLFSSHVHGLPMSYFRMGEQDRGRGMPSEVEQGYTTICLSLAATLLAATRDEDHELFKTRKQAT
jgi:hypothetical protein